MLVVHFAVRTLTGIDSSESSLNRALSTHLLKRPHAYFIQWNFSNCDIAKNWANVSASSCLPTRTPLC